MIQHLEGTLSVSITLKKDVQYRHGISKEEANNFLEEYRSLTLGQAIKIVKKNGLYSDTLYSDLKALLEERYRLVHRFLHHHLDGLCFNLTKDSLFYRIKNHFK